MEDFGFKLEKTRLSEALQVLKAKGMKGIVMYTNETGWVLLAADGLLDVLSFESNGILLGYLPFDTLIKPGTVPRGWAVIAPLVKTAARFYTAENLYLLHGGVYTRSVYIIRIKDPYGPETTENILQLTLDLEDFIAMNGGSFNKPKWVYLPKKNWVILTAYDDNGRPFTKVLGFNAETGEVLGVAPASAFPQLSSAK